MASAKNTAAVKTFGDHEVIVPENKLRKAVSKEPFNPDDDPVARAEKALADLSGEFAAWMDMECDRLDAARQKVKLEGFDDQTKEALFHAAHDLKGQAATFGFPAVASAADSLCRLIELTPNAKRIPPVLLDQHVDAVRAIYREYARSDAKELAKLLTRRLREVTDEFLIGENRNRPDVLEQIKGPSLVPE
ncbi:MAG TPA: Hpt domain-containing protein [Pseudolabrys sp.]|nr:Hpt domain-containing protein [Pseudolabrys sp.]